MTEHAAGMVSSWEERALTGAFGQSVSKVCQPVFVGRSGYTSYRVAGRTGEPPRHNTYLPSFPHATTGATIGGNPGVRRVPIGRRTGHEVGV